MKKRRKLHEVLFNNLGLKLGSLVLSFAIWVLVASILDPTDTATFNNIRVNFINTELLEDQGKVYEVLNNTNYVRVTVRGPRSVTKDLVASDIVAEADMSKLTDINTIQITYSLTTDDTVDSITGNHDTVELSVEDKASKYVTLSCRPVGSVNEDYVLGDIKLEENRIEISGPKSAVDRVRYARVDVNVEGATSSISANMEVDLYNANDMKINPESLTMQTDRVHVEVIVLSTKSVPVYASRTGTPAEGYLYSNKIYVSPETVKVAGTQTALSGISVISLTDPVDITGAEENVTQTFDISPYLPEGVNLVDTSTDGLYTVTVYVEPISYRTLQIPVANLSLTEIPEAAELSLDESGTIEVRFSGLAEELEQMTGETVLGMIEVGTWMESEGVSQLEARHYEMPVTFLTGGTVKASQPAYVTVVVHDTEEDDEE